MTEAMVRKQIYIYKRQVTSVPISATTEKPKAARVSRRPVLNNGMPVQRTYTEWKYSAFGRNEAVAGVADNRRRGGQRATSAADDMHDDRPN